jgi:hypothetical protein
MFVTETLHVVSVVITALTTAVRHVTVTEEFSSIAPVMIWLLPFVGVETGFIVIAGGVVS